MTRILGRRTLGVVVAAAAVLGVASCDDGTPVTEPPTETPSAAATATASPSPTKPSVEKPERPAAMDDDGPAGAEAAAKYFLELDPYVQATGDTAEWERMSHQECATCAARLKQAQEIAAGGYVWVGGVTTVGIVHTYAKDAVLEAWPIDVRVHVEAAKVTDPSGNVVFQSDVTDHQRRIEVGRRDGSWIIIGIAAPPEE